MNNSRLTAGLAAMLIVSAACFASEDTITLPAGTELQVELITTLSSKTNETGDLWTGKVALPIFGQGTEIVPEGSTVDGHITFVNTSGHARAKSKDKESGEMLLIADSISTPDGSKYNIVANPEAAHRAQTQDQGPGGITALARNFSKKGKYIVIPQGTEVTFQISHDTTATKVPVRQ